MEEGARPGTARSNKPDVAGVPNSDPIPGARMAVGPKLIGERERESEMLEVGRSSGGPYSPSPARWRTASATTGVPAGGCAPAWSGRPARTRLTPAARRVRIGQWGSELGKPVIAG